MNNKSSIQKGIVTMCHAITSEIKPENPVYDFHGHNVRVIMKDGEPWFVAKDVADVLDVSNPSDQLSLLDDDEKGVDLIETLGGKQKMSIVSESGLYAIIMRSRKPEAKPFRKWVTSEVLPSIRKTGGYVSGKTYDEIKKNAEAAAMLAVQRQFASSEFKSMATALKDSRALLGKETLPVHYMSEAKLINIVIMGCSPDSFRKKMGIPKNAAIRDYFTKPMLEAVADLESVNRSLLVLGKPYEERKADLKLLFDRRWSVEIGASIFEREEKKMIASE